MTNLHYLIHVGFRTGGFFSPRFLVCDDVAGWIILQSVESADVAEQFFSQETNHVWNLQRLFHSIGVSPDFILVPEVTQLEKGQT